MADLFDTIVSEGTATVTIRGITYHIHAASSHDTLGSGVAMLLSLNWDPTKEPISEKSILDVYKAMTPEGAKRNQAAKETMVCAGVSHVSRPDDSTPPQKVQLVMEIEKHEKTKGRLWVGYLKKETIEELYTAIMSLSTDQGAALERAMSFRGPSNGAAHGPLAGTVVSPDAVGDPADGS